MKGKRVFLKDKLFFSYSNGLKRVLGNAVSVGKALAKDFGLLHVVDEDLLLFPKVLKNKDVYDNLTYFIHVQVEAPPNVSEKVVRELLSFDVRVVLHPEVLEGMRHLFKGKEGFAVSKSKPLDWVRDVFLTFCPGDKERFKDKRLFVLGKCPGVFCEIEG